MLDRDFVWCGLNLLLDEEEARGKLCPSCLARVAGDCCPGCGVDKGQISSGVNENFDLAQFARRLKGELSC